jgi:spore germination protein YaaH
LLNFKKYLSLILILLLIFIPFDPAMARPRKTSNPPSVPLGLAVTSKTSSSVNLGWMAISGASGYKVYIASPSDSGYALSKTVSVNSVSLTGLSPSTTYWFYVTAYNSYGTSAASSHISTMTLSPPPVSSKLVLGFATYYYSGDSSSYNSMTANTSSINEIATLTYTADSQGNISGLVPTSQVNYANNNGINSMVMVSNNFDGNIAKSILENQTTRQALISNIVNAIRANNYKGVNIDFEGVFYYDRSYFTAFMSELYSTLKPLGYMVTLDVPAKTYDSTTNSWNGAFDYAALSSYADQIVIMSYDEHYPGGTPGPVASIGWVQNVYNYAVTVIPKEKLLMGVAAYGYDWSSNGTKAYSINGINNLAAANNAQILWDDTSKTPYFSYTDSAGIQHSVWFENSTSLSYKLDIVNNLNLSGIAIWRLGLENSDYWTTIKTKLNK